MHSETVALSVAEGESRTIRSKRFVWLEPCRDQDARHGESEREEESKEGVGVESGRGAAV